MSPRQKKHKRDKGTLKIETTIKVEVVNYVPLDDQKNASKCQLDFCGFENDFWEEFWVKLGGKFIRKRLIGIELVERSARFINIFTSSVINGDDGWRIEAF